MLSLTSVLATMLVANHNSTPTTADAVVLETTADTSLTSSTEQRRDYPFQTDGKDYDWSNNADCWSVINTIRHDDGITHLRTGGANKDRDICVTGADKVVVTERESNRPGGPTKRTSVSYGTVQPLIYKFPMPKGKYVIAYVNPDCGDFDNDSNPESIWTQNNIQLLGRGPNDEKRPYYPRRSFTWNASLSQDFGNPFVDQHNKFGTMVEFKLGDHRDNVMDIYFYDACTKEACGGLENSLAQ